MELICLKVWTKCCRSKLSVVSGRWSVVSGQRSDLRADAVFVNVDRI